ncbi:hypothetical protein WJX74_002613 [Apatococcus lobatus]|uniref:PHD-type domain-containing protein n=1 Tax=Apatococcus lobatus TaxID=904363 RepID=A0AAW1S5Y1_9CHLO
MAPADKVQQQPARPARQAKADASAAIKQSAANDRKRISDLDEEPTAKRRRTGPPSRQSGTPSQAASTQAAPASASHAPASPASAQHDSPQPTAQPLAGHGKSPGRLKPHHMSPRKTGTTAHAIKQHIKEQALKAAWQANADGAVLNGADQNAVASGDSGANAAIPTPSANTSSVAAGLVKGTAEPSSQADKSGNATGILIPSASSSQPQLAGTRVNDRRSRKSASRGKLSWAKGDKPAAGVSSGEILKPPATATIEPAVPQAKTAVEPSHTAARNAEPQTEQQPQPQPQSQAHAVEDSKSAQHHSQQAHAASGAAAAVSNQPGPKDLSGPVLSHSQTANDTESLGHAVGNPASADAGLSSSDNSALANGNHQLGGTAGMPLIKPRSRKRPPVKDVHRHEVTEPAPSAAGSKKGRLSKGKPSGAAGKQATKHLTEPHTNEPGQAEDGVALAQAPSSAAGAQAAEAAAGQSGMAAADANGAAPQVPIPASNDHEQLGNGNVQNSRLHETAALPAQPPVPCGPHPATASHAKMPKPGKQPGTQSALGRPAQASAPLQASPLQQPFRHKPLANALPSSAQPTGSTLLAPEPSESAADIVPASTAAGNPPAGLGVSAQELGEDDGSLDWLLKHSTQMRTTSGWAYNRDMQLRPMLLLGCLAMQPVHVCTRSSGTPLLDGTITPEGKINCECSRCNGSPVSASEFEDHSGCKDHRPGNTIRLKRHQITLKDFLDRLNDTSALEGGRCRVCAQPEGLQECSSCGSFQHPACVGLQGAAPPQWRCGPCASKGRPSGGSRASSSGGASRVAMSAGRKEKKESSGTKRPRASGVSSMAASVAAEARRLAAGGVGGGRTALAAPDTPGFQRDRNREARKARNSSKHKVLFTLEAGALQDGEKVTYRSSQGIALLEGHACLDPHNPGIRCSHCDQVISPSGFEAHAGFGSKRAPYNFIHNSKGISLADIAKGLVDREMADEPEMSLSICALCKGPEFQDGNDFGPNTVLICDQCDREFHVKCLKERGICDLTELPSEDWYCSKECRRINEGLRRALDAGEVDLGGGSSWRLLHGTRGRPEDSDALETARTILQTSFDPIIDKVSGKDLLEAMVFAQELEDSGWDFRGMHTALLFHEDPPGSEDHLQLSTQLQDPLLANQQDTTLLDPALPSFMHATQVKREAPQEGGSEPVHGLKAEAEQPEGPPKKRPRCGVADAGVVIEERPKGKRPVAAAVFCAFGAGLAQLPFIATQLGERRRGHARSLCNAVEGLLASSGVATMCVPATYEAFPTWKGGLGFGDIAPHQRAAAKTFMGLLLFPGTQLLVKTLLPGQETLGLDEHGHPIEPVKPTAPSANEPDESQPTTGAGPSSEHALPEELSKATEGARQPGPDASASQQPLPCLLNGLPHKTDADHLPQSAADDVCKDSDGHVGSDTVQQGTAVTEQQPAGAPSQKRQKVCFADACDASAIPGAGLLSSTRPLKVTKEAPQRRPQIPSSSQANQKPRKLIWMKRAERIMVQRGTRGLQVGDEIQRVRLGSFFSSSSTQNGQRYSEGLPGARGAQPSRPEAMETDLEDPLLGESDRDDDQKRTAGGPPGPEANSSARQSSLIQSSSNLANTVVGAGIMSLPHAIAVLGVAFGSGVLVLVYLLARLSLAKLISLTQQTRAQSYSQLVRKQLGPAGDVFLQASIIINNAGILVVYLIILGDIAVGSPPKYDGLLSTWFGLDAGKTWYLARPFVVAVIAAVFLLPLSLLRSLSTLSKVSAVSLSLAAFFAAASGALGTYAALQGNIQNGLSSARWWPSFKEFTHPSDLLGLVATLPVLLTSYVCHYNLHPVMKDIQSYTQRRMTGAVDLGLGSCTLAYIVSGIGGYFLFNGHPSEDVLKSFTPAQLAPLLGDNFGSITEIAVRASYLVVLLCHAPIVSFGLRELILEKMFGDEEPHAGAYSGVTLLIVAAAYVFSVVIPNVWTFLQITGATAALALAYIIPALLMLKMDKTGSQRALGVFVLVASCGVSVASILQQLLQLKKA